MAAALPPGRPAPPIVYKDRQFTIYELRDAAPYFEARLAVPADGGRQDLRASCDAPASIVRREMTFPGWRVTSNGTEKPLKTAPPFFQEVDLPPGDSQLHYSYRPPRIGWTYAAFWLGVIALFVPGRCRRYRKDPLPGRIDGQDAVA